MPLLSAPSSRAAAPSSGPRFERALRNHNTCGSRIQHYMYNEFVQKASSKIFQAFFLHGYAEKYQPAATFRPKNLCYDLE